jgi:hypothetical protein
MPVKRRMYDTEADFASERGLLEAEGWTLRSFEMVRGRGRWLKDLSPLRRHLLIGFAPNVLFTWWRVRNAPAEQIEVFYERER